MKENDSWLHHFHPYTATHLCVVLSFALLVTVMVSMRRCDDVATVPPRRRIMDKSLGWLGLAAALFVQATTLWPTRFDYRTALPLHICDIVMFVAPAALVWRWRRLRAIAYFWGLGLSSLSFVWPDLRFGPGDFQFWVFWAGHVTIVGTALYDITARGFRPNWHDWRFAVWSGLVYVAVMFPLDALLHVNYGYVGRTYQGQQSPFDLLGPWPWRVPMMFMMANVVMLLLFVPWLIARKAAANRSGRMVSAGLAPLS